jgi:beta-lactamase superfamily II metal-dependent hydrolase
LTVSRRGAVLLLEWKRFRALLPLGMDFDNLAELESRTDIRPVTALLLAGSGYAPLNPPEWIISLDPQVILLSVGSRDATSLPSSALLESVQEYNLLRTDRDGWIEIRTDGQQMWVEAAR